MGDEGSVEPITSEGRMIYHCPYCGQECKVTQHSGPNLPRGPEQGEFAFCGGCNSLLIATTDDFRLGTRRDLDRLRPGERAEIEKAFGGIRYAPGA